MQGSFKSIIYKAPSGLPTVCKRIEINKEYLGLCLDQSDVQAGVRHARQLHLLPVQVAHARQLHVLPHLVVLCSSPSPWIVCVCCTICFM